MVIIGSMARPARGVTLLEILIAMAVLLVALLGLIGAIVSAQSAGQSTRELTVAMNEAREKVEEMRSQPFDEIFRRYNSSTGDDLAGSNPGATFTVSGLNALAGTPAGQIVFPGDVPATPGQLLENVVDAPLGMPHDLNGDGDATDNAATGYRMLPVRIQIRWQGINGPGRFDLNTVIYER